MKCSDLMEKNVVTCREDESAYDCAKVMRDQNVGFVPIVDDGGKVIGTVTDRDLVVRFMADGKSGGATVGELMSRDVVWCSPDDDLVIAESKMETQHIARMLVCDGDTVCGVISLSDIAQAEDAARTGELLKSVTQREQRSFA